MFFKRGKRNKSKNKDQTQGQSKNWKCDKPVENKVWQYVENVESHPLTQWHAAQQRAQNAATVENVVILGKRVDPVKLN